MSSFKSVLTPRRKEALETLRRLASERGEGVHYSLVGIGMGISAWTAYGLLRELERSGLAQRGYALGGTSRQGGRARILFSPTAGPVTLAAEVAERLQAAFERFAAIADERLAARDYLSSTLQDAGDDLGFHLGYWMGRLEAAGQNAQAAARALLEGTAGPGAKIQGLFALGLGASLARLAPSRLASRITDAGTGFVSLLDDGQRTPEALLAALVEAARALLRRHPGASGVLAP
ncbi:MAG TPA: hypothetical protein VNI34_04730 [Candidatus Nitrosotalea sp.]|nr:hypothetical protein [Candidatus Nitrosotalea sp.]